MQHGYATTPFGRRPMTLALVKGEAAAARPNPEKAVNKWKIFRDLCAARNRLGLQDRALAVLNALLSFYPQDELSAARGLVVFPSNAQLSLRAHGISETTLRRHLAVLVEAGLLLRRDSPNGKRYAHRNSGGVVETAFGFSLAPLLARAEEIAALARAVLEEAQHLRRLRESLTLCRRDLRKLIALAREEGPDDEWLTVEAECNAILAGLPRKPAASDLEHALAKLGSLRSLIFKYLNKKENIENMTDNDVQNDRHIQNSESESGFESEAMAKQKRASGFVASPPTTQGAGASLSDVLKACPQIGDYGPHGRINTWHDLQAATLVVRSMLRIDANIHAEAAVAMGCDNAAIAIACILERALHIRSPGGYLRNLAGRARRGLFSPGPMLKALLRERKGEAGYAANTPPTTMRATNCWSNSGSKWPGESSMKPIASDCVQARL